VKLDPPEYCGIAVLYSDDAIPDAIPDAILDAILDVGINGDENRAWKEDCG
jgi:hypothetical protein